MLKNQSNIVFKIKGKNGEPQEKCMLCNNDWIKFIYQETGFQHTKLNK